VASLTGQSFEKHRPMSPDGKTTEHPAPPRGKKQPPGLRADAERNRRRVLEVAQEVFASEGLSVRVEEIARRAGVGVGTVYRHFPTKEALFQAIVVDRIGRSAAHAERLNDAEDPGAAVFALIEHLVAEGAAKKDFVDALGGAIPSSPDVQTSKRRFRDALGRLLSRAQKARAVRADVDVADVISLVHGVLADPHASPATRARRAAIICDGLRPLRAHR
jgi:AcrR family transcriptional regulator